ncbi:hypothetical protein PSYAR_31573, partial [Pseudomonas syringae pv. aceris str. M302273]
MAREQQAAAHAESAAEQAEAVKPAAEDAPASPVAAEPK